MFKHLRGTHSTYIYDSAYYIKDIKQSRALSRPLLTRKRHGYWGNQRGPTYSFHNIIDRIRAKMQFISALKLGNMN